MIHTVYRVQCEGRCRGWLRRGRVAPPHWGSLYAELFSTPEQAGEAAQQAGWVDGRCPKDQLKGGEKV